MKNILATDEIIRYIVVYVIIECKSNSIVIEIRAFERSVFNYNFFQRSCLLSEYGAQQSIAQMQYIIIYN